MAEALLTGLLFLATCLMLILSPFLPRRAAGVIWLLIGGGEFWLSSLATAVKGGTVSAVILYGGYAVMLGTGAMMLRGWRQSLLGVAALDLWFGLVVFRFFQAGPGLSAVIAGALLAWTLGWNWRLARTHQ
ncbi:MAG TPA: hypothetical protein VD973_26425 [Symbiobacteriaceae bacterium]|nr:hypothetical protein [Symbiobacteriaceae bacterium]